MKKTSYLIIILLLLNILSFSSKAQIKKRADNQYNKFNFQEAISLYEHILTKDSSNMAVNHKLADAYRLINNSEKAEYFYHIIIKDSTQARPIDLLYYSKSLQQNKKYKQAEIWVQKYAKFNSLWNKNINSSEIFIHSMYRDSLLYNVFPVNINSEQSDFGPAFYHDKIVYSSSREKKSIVKRKYGWNNQSFLSLYVSNKSNSGDLTGVNEFSDDLYSKYHDGPVCFNENGTEIFITRNFLSKSNKPTKSENDIVNLMIYHSKLINNEWTKPQLIAINKEGYSTGHPSLSQDGKTLYFTSDRPGGMGGKDIYKAKRMGKNWSEPINLGAKVNTCGDEMFPFISEDEILYFASNGYPGLGGLDIFYKIFNNNKPAKNMGASINSNKDDFGLIIKNAKGYFASNRKKGQSFDNIYSFGIKRRVFRGVVLNKKNNSPIIGAKLSIFDNSGKLVDTKMSNEFGCFEFFLDKVSDYNIVSEKESFEISGTNIYKKEIANLHNVTKNIYHSPIEIKTHILTGTVYNTKNKKILGNTVVSLCNNNDEIIEQVVTDDSGRYRFLLIDKIDYNLKSEKVFFEEGRASISKNIVIISEKINKDIYQTPVKIEINKVFVLNNIYYDTNKAKIRGDAALELDKLIILLDAYPKMVIELSSHTDSRGSSKYNRSLSQRRANSCVKYLISKGIAPYRLKAKGYGESKLINRCADGVKCSKLEHQQNRRTEVKVLKVD